LKGLTADKSPVKSLDFCSVEPRVVAGSEDGTFCLWSMEDHSFESFGETCVLPRFYTRLKDFAFQQTAFSPRSCQIVTAVSRQGQQVLWDLRAAEPTSSLQLGHQMNNCAWGSLNEHSILYVGSNAVFLVDLRKSSEQSIVKSFVLAEEALSVEWSPFQESLFAVSGRNGMSLIMDSNAPAEQAIKFHHFSHTGDVHQIHWNPFEAWTLASVSGNTENQTGCVQLWRPNALILMNDEEFETNVIRNL
jgi:histone-binding protein RBBP4